MPELKEVFEIVSQKVEPDTDAWQQQDQRRRRRARNGRIGAFAVVAAIAIIAAIAVIAEPRRDRTTDLGANPTEFPTSAIPETDYLVDLDTGEMTPLPESIAREGDSDWYAVSPDGTTLSDGTMVAYDSPDAAGTTQVFIASPDGADIQQMTHDLSGAGAPAWSFDGAAIAYQAAGDGDVNNIFVLDVYTGAASQVTNEKPTSEIGAVGAQFSPGGEIVYSVDRGSGWGVRWVLITGGRSTLLVGGGKDDVQAGGGTLSPDGSTLAVWCEGRLWGICIANADGTNLRLLVSDFSLFGPKWSPDGTRIAYYNGDTKEVFAVDVATGESTLVAEGTSPVWLDDHTLIIEITESPS